MKCPNCAAEVGEKDNFCSKCGFELRGTSSGEGSVNILKSKAAANQTDDEKQESEELLVTYVESLTDSAPEQTGENSEKQEGEGDAIQPQIAEADEDNLQGETLPNQQLSRLPENIIARLEGLEQAHQEQNRKLASLQSEFEELAQKRENDAASLEAEGEEIQKINNQLSEQQDRILEQQGELQRLGESLSKLQEWLQWVGEGLPKLQKWLQWFGEGLPKLQEWLQRLGEGLSKLQEWLQRVREGLPNLISQLSSPFAGRQQNDREYPPSTTEISPPGKQPTPPEPASIAEGEKEGEDKLPLSEEEQLLKDYKENSDLLSEKATVVAEAKNSIEANRLGAGKTILEKEPRGKYWIVKQSGSEYLIPSNKIKINEFNRETVERLFECRGFQKDKSNDVFELLKPAKVHYLKKENMWQVTDKGILEFH